MTDACNGVHFGSFEKDMGKHGFIKQDIGGQNMFVLRWNCTGFNGSFPDVGTRVSYKVVTDAKSGKLRADNVVPEESVDSAATDVAKEVQVEEAYVSKDQGTASEGLRFGTFHKNAGKWGFILEDCSNTDLFVLPYSCKGFGSVFPAEGTRVRYEMIQDAKTGKPRADNVLPETDLEPLAVEPAVEGEQQNKDSQWEGSQWGSSQWDSSQQVEQDQFEPLSRSLASVLRHRASALGVHIRPDGFALLPHVLSNSAMFRAIEQVLPGTCEGLKSTGVVPDQLLEAVRTIVNSSLSNGRPRFEIWEDTSSGSVELWIRATHKHSIPHVVKEEPTEGASDKNQDQPQREQQSWKEEKQPKWDNQQANKAISWSGSYSDSWDTSSICTLTQVGNKVTATGNKFPKTFGTVSGNTISLFGLTGTLSNNVISWSSGSEWSLSTDDTNMYTQDQAKSEQKPCKDEKWKDEKQLKWDNQQPKKAVYCNSEEAVSWSGSYSDSWDPSSICTLTQAGNKVTATGNKFPKTFGTVNGKTISLFGLTGTLSNNVISWSSGSEWSLSTDGANSQKQDQAKREYQPRKDEQPKWDNQQPKKAVSWAGSYADSYDSSAVITVNQLGNKVSATGNRFPKTFGTVSENTISLFGLTGTLSNNAISWSNGSEWTLQAAAEEPVTNGKSQNMSVSRPAHKEYAPVPTHTMPAQKEDAPAPTRTMQASKPDAQSRPVPSAGGSSWCALLGDNRGSRRRTTQPVETFAISTPPRARPNSEMPEDCKSTAVVPQEQPKPSVSVRRAHDTDPWGGCRSWSAGAPVNAQASMPLKTAPAPANLRPIDPRASQPANRSETPQNPPSDATPSEGRVQGKIRSFNPEKGYGFVVCDSVKGDIFLNATTIIGDHPPKCNGYPGTPAAGPEMSFDLEVRNGRPRAINARVVGDVCEAAAGKVQAPLTSAEVSTNASTPSKSEWDNSEQDDSLRPDDILKMLPGDAPPGVRAYLEALAQAQGGA